MWHAAGWMKGGRKLKIFHGEDNFVDAILYINHHTLGKAGVQAYQVIIVIRIAAPQIDHQDTVVGQ
jgi:hypothetical protein